MNSLRDTTYTQINSTSFKMYLTENSVQFQSAHGLHSFTFGAIHIIAYRLYSFAFDAIEIAYRLYSFACT